MLCCGTLIIKTIFKTDTLFAKVRYFLCLALAPHSAVDHAFSSGQPFAKKGHLIEGYWQRIRLKYLCQLFVLYHSYSFFFCLLWFELRAIFSKLQKKKHDSFLIIHFLYNCLFFYHCKNYKISRHTHLDTRSTAVIFRQRRDSILRFQMQDSHAINRLHIKLSASYFRCPATNFVVRSAKWS